MRAPPKLSTPVFRWGKWRKSGLESLLPQAEPKDRIISVNPLFWRNYQYETAKLFDSYSIIRYYSG